MNAYLLAAQQWLAAGCNVIPVRTDSENPKAPALASWKEYITRLSTQAELAQWFGSGHAGMGIVCGAISGNLEMLEFEGRAVSQIESFMVRLNGQSTGLVQKLWSYVESSPSGGIHFFYRVSGVVDGNTKLARNANGETLIETRGEGGQVVVAPSKFKVYADTDAWHVLNGSSVSIPVITEIELEIIHEVARTFDEMPPPIPIPDTFKSTELPAGDLTPGQDFNIRGSWHDMLVDNGWRVFQQGEGDKIWWTRPGKRWGKSAVTGGEYGDYFYCWSTSVGLLPDNEALSKWRVYAYLYHNGDFSAAASALRKDGYGSPLKHAPVPTSGLDPTLLPPMSGASSTVEPVKEHPGFQAQLRFAMRFVAEHGDNYRYVYEMDEWRVWDGMRWAPSRTGPPIPAAMDTVGKAWQEAYTLPDGPARAGLLKDHKKMQFSGSLQGMLAVARTLDPIALTVADIDNDPYLFNCHNGTFDMRTGELRPHSKEDNLTKLAGCGLDLSLVSDTWERVLATALPDVEVQDWVQRLFGYAMLGVVKEEILPIFSGEGGNGKSVLLELVNKAFGSYGQTIDVDVLTNTDTSKHSNDRAELFGTRLAITAETNDGAAFAAATVKKLTGGDTITARQLYAKNIRFVPSHTIVMMTNYHPRVQGDDVAMWDRLRIVPFDVKIRGTDKEIPGASIALERELPAILAWVARGYQKYAIERLRAPEAIARRTAQYHQDSDQFSRFWDERILVNEYEVHQSSTFYEAWKTWCITNGESALAKESMRRFSMRMERRGFTSKKHNGGRKHYFGIRLKTWNDRDDHEAGDDQGRFDEIVQHFDYDA